jgi:Undecaprenyl-phosphate galactose phosphotransferase WbaP
MNKILLFLSDIFTLYLSIFCAYYTRKYFSGIFSPLQIEREQFLALWWIPGIFVMFLLYEGLYTRRRPFWDEVKELIKTASISMIFIISIITFGKLSDRVSRPMIVFLWGYALIFFPLSRLITKKILYSLNLWMENVIIIGADPMGLEAARGLDNHNYIGYRVLGFFDDDPRKIRRYVKVGKKKIKVFGKVKYFKKFVSLLNITTVVIALPSLPQNELARLTNEIQQYVKTVLFVPDLRGISILNTEIYHLFNEEYFLFKIKNNLKSPLSRAIKKIFDIVVGFLMLPLLLPVIAVIALLIKLDSKGPIFYTQPRVGQNRRMFKICKFRSMYNNAQERLKNLLATDEHIRNEWEANFKLKDDPRITKIGKFLRKTSLDELPQIFNVLKGDMSLVGPRPVLQEEIDLYYKTFSQHYYLVRPGITGIWQVSGRSDINYDRRVRLDTWYVLNWSVWLDTVILFKTIKVVTKREGAY